MSDIEKVVGRLLHAVQGQEFGATFEHTAAALLEQVRAELPGVCGAFLLSQVPASKPEPPLRCSGWRPNALQDIAELRALARFVSTFKRTTYVSIWRPLPNAECLKWVQEQLREPAVALFAICPLQQYVSPDIQGTAALRLVLVVAFSAAADPARHSEPHRSELELLAWLLAHLRVNYEAPRLARRCRTLADIIDQGVAQILTRVPAPANVRELFNRLVGKIRLLLNCDTCQLYLLPQYAEGMEAKQARDRIWLVAESVANREGLRYYRSDTALFSYLWRNPQLSPLNVPNLLDDPQYGQYALGKLGLTRHFLGMVLPGAPSAALGIVTALDRYAPDLSVGGHPCTAQDGFTAEDQEALVRLAGELTGWLRDNRGLLIDPEVRRQLRERVKRIREALSADTCQLYLRPEVIGTEPVGTEEYLELVCNARRDWSQDASYARGEGLTGQVFMTGQDRVVEDGLGSWLALVRDAEKAGRRKPGKYRVSQHLMAVPIPAPPLLGADEAVKGPIGVLKVRDRLRSDEKTLSLRPFSREDSHLLHAFARMIAVEIGMREYALQRKVQEMLRLCYMTHAFRHVVAGNLIKPAILHLRRQENLPPELRWLPGLLEDADNMLDRSWVGAAIAAGRHTPEHGAPCDLGGILQELFPEPERCLAPDRDESRADVSVRLGDAPAADAVWVLCERRLIELAVLVLPVALYHAARVAPGGGPLPVEVSAQAGGPRAVLRFRAPTGSRWSEWPPEEMWDELTYIVSYPRRLQCPPIPFGAFQKQLAHYNATLHGEAQEDETSLWIEFERTAGPRKKERATAVVD